MEFLVINLPYKGPIPLGCAALRPAGNKINRYLQQNKYSYFIEFTHQTCMKKVHDNVHKRYSDKRKNNANYRNKTIENRTSTS